MLQFGADTLASLGRASDANRQQALQQYLRTQWPENFSKLTPAQSEQRVGHLISVCDALDADSRGLEARVYALFIQFDAQPRNADQRELFYQVITGTERPLVQRLARLEQWLGLGAAP